ncbi:cupredoxin domain-containing protein [Bacillus sp. FJAT-44742]|uniref:cupredoxin domain-containing protein n=1 Tax=Bacillus sp. FJAT-44742 TaxID=2014005 RepID=UPI000C23D196|nr:cupredoxin domain-containing protein [Bacillus sp. FJAT-44742]
MLHLIALVIIITLLLSWLLIFSYLFKSVISNMAGMVIAMTLGMIVGLSTGTITSILYPTAFFEMTVISMLIGLVIGVISGYPFSLAASLEGLMAGIMGGMMGTMLGVMSAPETFIQLLRVMTLLTVAIFFLVYLLQIHEINKVKMKKNVLFQPLAYFFVVFLFIISFHTYSFPANISIIDDSTQGHASHNNIMLHATEYNFHPKDIRVPLNEEITFTLTNSGSQEHDFVIKEAGAHIHTSPRTTNSQSVIFTEPGIYQAICSLPGHKEAGMVTSISVVSTE